MRIAFALSLLMCVSVFAWCQLATAQDLNTALYEAESRAQVAADEVSSLQAELQPAQERLDASNQRAAPVAGAARAADRRLANIESNLQAHRRAAAAKLGRIERERHDAVSKHDKTVRSGLGFGLAMLVAACIAFAWGWFRASALVAWLTGISRNQAIGLCVGGGLTMFIIGGALSDTTGVVGVLGIFLIGLGFVLANALALARHSAEVQRGRSKPISRRERLPKRVTQAAAWTLAALCLIGLGSAVFAGDASSNRASAELRHEASKDAVNTSALAQARQRAANLDHAASVLVAAAHADYRDLQAIRRKLSRANARLHGAQRDAANFNHQLAVIAAREQRAAERQAEEAAAAQCDSNYSGCLDPNAVDYDCEGGSGNGPLYTGTVSVLGVDHYGLDEDGDGIGCDS